MKKFAAALLLAAFVAPAAYAETQHYTTTSDDVFQEVTGQKGYGSVEFYKFQIVTPDPAKPGGFIPVTELTPAGADIIGDAALLGNVADASFYLIDENGRKLQDITLTPDFKAEHYRGHFKMPGASFRVVAYGHDNDNQKFARVSAELISLKAPQ